MKQQVLYKTIDIDGVSLFYRQAGLPGQPTLLLLHGFPSSSHMYRDLIAALAEKYYVVAPDYPGFGQSSSPDISTFAYTFDNLSTVIERFIDQLQLEAIHLYMQDYGGPIGMRIATRRPGLIRSLIIQNANAYLEGLGDLLEPLTAYIQDAGPANEARARYFLSIDATRFQYLHGAGDASKVSPDSYSLDQYYLNRPGNDLIQLALFRDYGSNIALYETWHQYFRQHQPRALVIWGIYDAMFIAPGANAYTKDLPGAEVILVEGGHFLLEEHHHFVAEQIDRFVAAGV
ncbi:alpha/beta fold hydrolase [Paraflavitalea pollutisoli]|uniref:alpha/beta fold hydrolase n=1 Tax=Paraflavitalea pollutisoli TaxID=3034143 RepID=UPI0023EC91EE|nr:alpha/beta hydrolase [Paraflavitalea sp. H1-2-19X]